MNIDKKIEETRTIEEIAEYILIDATNVDTEDEFRGCIIENLGIFKKYIQKETAREMVEKIENTDIQVGSPCKPVANMVKTAIIKHLQRYYE